MSTDKAEELKQKLDDEQLAETIEQIIEEKVQQRIEKKENETAINKEKQNISRRKFIKKMGAGALGLGAAAIIPSTSALDVRDSTGLNVYQNSTEYLDVSSTSVNVLNTVLQEQGNRVATRNWVNNNTSSFSGSHTDLTNISSNDHHSRYSDSEARSAVNGANIDITGDADTVDGQHASELGAPSSTQSASGKTGLGRYSGTTIVGAGSNKDMRCLVATELKNSGGGTTVNYVDGTSDSFSGDGWHSIQEKPILTISTSSSPLIAGGGSASKIKGINMVAPGSHSHNI